MLLKNRGQSQPVALQRYLGIADTKQRQQPKRLSMKHKYCILFHLEGFATGDICETLKCSPTFVYNTLKSEQAQAIIQEYQSYLDVEFKSLYALSIEAIRRGLNSLDDEVALKAADKFLKAHGRYDRKDGPAVGETAEDVIRRVLTLQVVEEKRGAPARAESERGGEQAMYGSGVPREGEEPMDSIESLCSSIGLHSGDGHSKQLPTLQHQQGTTPDNSEQSGHRVVETSDNRERILSSEARSAARDPEREDK